MTQRASLSDPSAFRRLFPALAHSVHLASCSLGARSVLLDKALATMLGAMGAHGAPWSLFEAQYAQARDRFAALVGARAEQVAVLPSVSVAAWQVASTLSWRRPKLVSTTAEFPGVLRAWISQRDRGADVVLVGDRTGWVDAQDYLSAIDDRTALVSIPLTTFRYGIRLPVDEITAAAHAAGAQVFVDGYQSVGVESVGFDALGCDYLATGMAKYGCGLPGVAFLAVRHPAAGDLQPRLTSWLAYPDPFVADPSAVGLPLDARRFEIGTHAVPSLFAANAGLAVIGGLDLPAVRAYVCDLIGYAIERLSAMGEQVRTAPDPAMRGAHIAVVDADPPRLARWLAMRRVTVSPRSEVVRVSLHFYSSHADIDALCEELRRFRAVTGPAPPNAFVAGGRHA